MSKKDETALTKIETFPLISADSKAEAELIQQNLGGTLSIGDLPGIKVPSGGGSTFEVPTLDGVDPRKEIESIIIYRRKNQNKVYWASNEPSNNPPDCFSNDGITGEGNPGGLCKNCQYNKFGSAFNAKGDPLSGKACKDVQLIFPLLSGHRLPFRLSLPPTSLKNFRNYLSMLTQHGIPYYGVFTTIGLTQAQSQGGVKYSQVTFKLADRIPPENVAVIRDFVFGENGLSTFLESVPPIEKDNPFDETPFE